MTKEQKIREYESKQLIDELSKMPPMVIATAYLYAINFTLYGEDVTEKWVTATQQAYVLEKAHRKGYYEALQNLANRQPIAEWIQNDFDKKHMTDDRTVCSKCGGEYTDYIWGHEWDTTGDLPNFCPHCGYRMKNATEKGET